MHPTRWLETVFGSESSVRILRLLVTGATKSRTEREIAQAVCMSPNAVNRTIRRLASEGVVNIEKVGNAHVVWLRADDTFHSALQSLFESEQELWSAALMAIKGSVPQDAACYLFGSSARGNPHAGSDIDLLVIARDREKAGEVAYAIQTKVHEKLPARLHVIALSVQEASKRLRKKNGVVGTAIEQGELLSERSYNEVASA